MRRLFLLFRQCSRTEDSSIRSGLVLIVELLALATIIAVSGHAQSYNPTSAATMTGAPPYSTHEILREDVALASGGLHVYVPIISLRGKGGQTFSLGWAADSHSITMQEFDEPTGWNSPQNGALNPYVFTDWFVSPEVHGYVTIPHLRASWQFLGDYCDLIAEGCVNYSLFCNSNFTFRDENGTSYTFSESIAATLPVARDCTNTGQTGKQAYYTNPVGDSDQSPGIRLDTSNPNDIIVWTKDGTAYHFPAVSVLGNTSEALNYYDYDFLKIVDPNGNTITKSGSTITDSTGRTITAVNLSGGTSGSSVTWTDSNGSPQTFTAALGGTAGPAVTTHATGCNFLNPYQSQYQSQSYRWNDIGTVGNFATGMTLSFPDGAVYALQFDQLGKITKITYPGGGYTRYDYTDWDPQFHLASLTCYAADYWEVSAKHVCSSTSGSCTQSTEVTTTYTPISAPTDGGNGGTDVVDPLANRTHYIFGEVKQQGTILNSNPRETERDIYQGQSTLVKTIQTAWTSTADNAIPNKVTTILNDVTPNLTSYVTTSFDTPQGGTTVIDNPLEIDEYDFDGTLKRKTNYTWQKGGNYTVTTGHILDRPLSKTITDPVTGNVSTTTYVNDAIGNVKSVTRGGTNATSATTSYTRNSFGDVTLLTDPANNKTNYCYDGSSSCPNSSTTDLYGVPTAKADALSNLSLYSYSLSTGLLLSVTDPNTQVTHYSYDALGRVKQISYPDGGQTNHTYVDTAPQSVTTTTKITSAINKTTEALLDGIGRVIQTQLTDPLGTDYTDTTYDALERVSTVSNPHRSTSSSTDGTTSYVYDELGRVCVVVPQDGTAVSACPATAPVSDVFTKYTGNCSTTTDQAGKSRKSCVDGLGRMTGVWEDPAGLDYETDYAYDAFGNLTAVTQKGGASSSSWRNRSFVYDGLSQLTKVVNPESGTIQYTYDVNGNVKIKTAPAPNQLPPSTATVTTTYNYDALNRLAGKTYSDGSPWESYHYDVVAPSFPTFTNVAGRLSYSYNQYHGGTSGKATYTSYSYDAMGRVVQMWQQTPSLSPGGGFVYATYDLMGNVTSTLSPANHAISYSYDAAARLTSITGALNDANHPSPLWSADATQGYYPTGALQKAQFGNGLYETIVVEPRLQPCRLSLNTSGGIPSGCSGALPTGVIQGHQLVYGTWGSTNNGNLTGWAGNGAVNFNRGYTYDSLNRIWKMSDSQSGAACTGLQWTIDPWSNMTAQTTTGGTCNSFSAAVGTNNQLVGYQYDIAGNMMNDGSHNYTYDAENRISQVDGGTTATYAYNESGQRVRKATGSTWTEYFYAPDGKVLSDYNGTGYPKEYIYDGDRLVAQYNWLTGTTNFIHADHLGTTRVVTAVNQSVLDSLDFYPYGQQSSGDTTTTHKFTGKERDAESGLDNFTARYFGSTMGRFMSPDPRGGHPEDPQTLNRYAYVRNNPTTLTDPTGLDFYLRCSGGDTATCNGGHVGTTDDKGNFTATVVTSDSIRAGQNSANVDQNGVEVTTGGKTYSGQYFDNPASHTTDADGNDVNHNPVDLKGGGQFVGFSFNINGNCNGTCLASGSFSFNAPRDFTGNVLELRGSFRSIVDRRIPGWGKSLDEWEFHPGTEQYRFGTGPSPHFSLPDNPKDTVPTVGPFHVDKDAPGLQHLGCAKLGVGCQ